MPFTIGESRSSDIYGRQLQFADTLSWSRGMHTLRIGGSLVHHTSGGTGSEPGQAVLGTFTFLNTTTRAVRAADAGRRAAVPAAGQLRHHQLRAEAVDVGGVRAGQHPRAATT